MDYYTYSFENSCLLKLELTEKHGICLKTTDGVALYFVNDSKISLIVLVAFESVL